MYDEHISRDPKIFTVYLNNLKLTSFSMKYESLCSIINHLILIGTRAHDIPLVEEEQISVTS